MRSHERLVPTWTLPSLQQVSLPMSGPLVTTRRAESALGEWRARLERKEITVEERIRMGRRGPEVVRCAQEERCDLVVLRSHVLDRGEPIRGIGTVSHQVALAASCPVLLVR